MKTNIAVEVNNFVEAMGVRKIMEVAGYKPICKEWSVQEYHMENIQYIRLSGDNYIVRSESAYYDKVISFDELCRAKRTITLDGKEIEISEENYQEFKKQFK